jgi:hypothetical protein
MRTTRSTRSSWWLGGLLACVGAPAAALTTTPDTDAFNLAAALAPAPGVLNAVTGSFVEVGPSAPGTGAVGIFTEGLASLGFGSGVVLSTGDVSEIFTGASPTSGKDFGWTPLSETATLLSQVPGAGVGYFDTVRFSVTIDPGFDASYINFDLAYGSNEVALSTDRLGIFVDGQYFGLLAGQPIDQHHSWVSSAGSGFGFGENLYPEGSPLKAPFVTVSLPVPSRAVAFTLDLVLADVTDGEVDSAVFLGNLSGSTTPAGEVLAPVPLPAAAWFLGSGLALVGVGYGRRRAD